MNKIVLTGPESTGKTTLAGLLNERFKGALVGEYAREYIEGLKRPYTQEDLLSIAQGQLTLEQKASSNAKLLICDTDLLTIKVWSEFKFGSVDSWIDQQLKKNLPDLYLLCYPDLDWEFDPLRENPNDLKELFETYLVEVKRLGVPFFIVKGQGEQRLERAVNAVDKKIYK